MKVKFSALVSDMRGKLNGSVASRNRGGSYLRNKTTPINPQSPAQQAIRSAFGNISSQWRNLGEDQRNAFRDFADSFPYVDIFGDQRHLSGSQMFQRIGINMSLINQSPLTSPIFPAGFPAFTGEEALSTVDGAGDRELLISGLPIVTSGFMLLVYATPSLSAGVNFAKNRFRLIGAFDTAGDTSIDVIDEYEEVFDPMTANQKMFVRFAWIDINAGLTSVPMGLNTIIEPV